MQRIYDKCRRREPLSREEAYRLYDEAPLQELALVADEVRRAVVPDPQVVTWQIDRNVNITNVCISGCKFCNFHCKPHQTDRAFITTMEQYCEKIDRTLRLGGDQLLLQGGLHPGLKIDFYERLFSGLKSRYPSLRLHALGAPEVAHIARISGLTTLETLRRLMAAGLDSLPGAGAEILDSDVRRAISPAKPSVEKWLDVMHEAHCLNLPTSATMSTGTSRRRTSASTTCCASATCRPAVPKAITASSPSFRGFSVRRAPSWNGRAWKPAFRRSNTCASSP